MKIRVLAYVVLLSALINGCAQGNQVRDKNDAQTKVDAIVASLVTHNIAKVEILHTPPYVERPIAITLAIPPDMIEKSFSYKLTIGLWATQHEKGLTETMKSVVVHPYSGMMEDIRWGVIFYDHDGRRVSVYLGEAGERGAVGNIPVTFKGDLFKWLDHNFSCCFR
jgi:hypothetical protein